MGGGVPKHKRIDSSTILNEVVVEFVVVVVRCTINIKIRSQLSIS